MSMAATENAHAEPAPVTRGRWRIWKTLFRPMSVLLAIGRFAKESKALIFCLAASSMLGAGFFVLVIWPRYKDPSTRLYTSKLGYGSIARKLGLKFEVASCTVQKRLLTSRLQGEGMLACEPIQIPIVAMSYVLKVHAHEGDHVTKGQLLVELDTQKAEIKLGSAKIAIEKAVAERQRVVLGSSYIAEHEKPERDKIRVEAAQTSARLWDEMLSINSPLARDKALSKSDLILARMQATKAQQDKKEQELSLRMAEAGLQQSIQIADSTIEDARLALRYRQLELEDYRVYAPCDGIIERCSIHDGEYNQDPGKPAFLLATGLWFEARLDQTTIGDISKGDEASIFLEAFPNQPIPGKVKQILPLVSYDLGGPEATRPVRPIGSGAPEWPSTFAVRIGFDTSYLPLVPGLTGFARISPSRKVVAVPVEAIFGRSGRSALVYLVRGEQYESRKVLLGATSEGFIEIVSGLEPGMELLSEGFHTMRPTDKLVLTKRDSIPLDQPVILRPVPESGSPAGGVDKK